MYVGCSLALQAGHTRLLSVAVSTSVRRQLVQKSAPQLSCRGRHRTFLHNLHCMVETLTGYRAMLDVYVYFCVPICGFIPFMCCSKESLLPGLQLPETFGCLRGRPGFFSALKCVQKERKKLFYSWSV